jgi:hypothetical protein
MRRAVIDEDLGVRVVARRELVYPRPMPDGLDHVRAASGLALIGDVLHVIQDDAAYVARVDARTLAAIDVLEIPVAGARRFEDVLGNRLDKPDFEACVELDGELLAFGSGTVASRERVVRLRDGAAAVGDGSAVFAAVRAAIGAAINIEGAAIAGDELWLLHRGNTGPADPGPAVARLPLGSVRAWLGGGEPPVVAAVDRYDLGTTGGARLGFTDAATGAAGLVFAAAAEAADDAITDGAILDAILGVIDDTAVRACPLRLDGTIAKAEGLALDPRDPRRAWLVTDRDDPSIPSVVYALDLIGPWRPAFTRREPGRR